MRDPRAFALLTGVLVFFDLVLIGASLAISYRIRFETTLFPPPDLFHSWEFYLPLATAEIIVFALVFSFRDMYHIRRNSSRLDELQRVVVSVGISAIVTVGLLAFLQQGFPYSRSLVVLSWGLAIPMIWVARLTQFRLHGVLRRAGIGNERVLIVGHGEIARAVLQKMKTMPNWGYDVAGYVADWSRAAYPAFSKDELPSLGNLDNIVEVVGHHRVNEVIIADPHLTHQDVLSIVQRLDPRLVSIKVFPDVFQLLSSEVSLSDLHGLPLLSVRDAALRGWWRGVKRVVDVALSVLVLIFLSPLMLLIALLIKVTSPHGPVFFAQERVGLDGRAFWVLKFRSMPPNAEAATGPVWATANDRRATRLGGVLRRFSFDELPQFVNVLVGDMSIVGPRPERPHFVRQFTQSIPHYWDRHREKAGLTGWAQVNGLRGDTSVEERTAYDLWYVENWNLLLDFKIMLRTIVAIFRHNNG